MKQFNKQVGAIGEQAAAQLLRKKGYQILESNFGTRFGEIDLIMKKDNVTIFVEVKAKTGDQYGEPWEMVGAKKLHQVKMMAQVYLTKNSLGEIPCRIDVVGVWLDREHRVDKIEHWEDVQINS